ncbi:MAG: thiol reductase thioredoxin [Acidobacteria bacterium]|nr:thiol reductase thioredoxin [Acidobacteriota bacterium]MCG3194493.1 Thioredoxin 2 [Thermoanaerobaculia bacterium]MCK6683090.1 thioredoxin domain-containing protein [Thermoanaerobaculia bacterium]
MISLCPSCNKKNRIPAANLLDRVICGSCKAEIPPPSEPIEADPALFEEVIKEAKVPVLVDFWAGWCGPCVMVAPFVRDAAKKAAGRAIVLKVNTEDHPDLAVRFRVQSIPNFVVFRNGIVRRQKAGLASPEQILSWLEVDG